MSATFGRYLYVDLASGAAEQRPIPPEVQRRFIGGTGLGVWLLRSLPDSVEPIGFVFSPLVGTSLTTSAKYAVVGRSPLTGLFNDALASSHFAIRGKATGNDAIVLAGRAAESSICIVDGDTVTIEPAGDLWGMTAAAAEECLRTRLGPAFCVAAIGPAGEARVPFATVSHDGRHAGRGGHGAVLGQKNIKCVAVRGQRKVPVADPPRVLALAAELRERSIGPATAKYRELGTLSNLLAFNALNALPTHNFRDASFAGAAALSAEPAPELRARLRVHCASCTIGCGHMYATGDSTTRMEYESAFALGPLCGVADRAAVLEANHLCDELGIDTISAGGTIAFAMECVERGLLDVPWLRFGAPGAVVRALRSIGTGEGVGELLRLGSRRMAERVGGGSERFAAHVKGLELPGYEPRTLQAMALGLAVNARGADHNRSGAYEADFSGRADRFAGGEDSVAGAMETEDNAALIDSMILCKFLRGVFRNPREEWAQLLEAVTGFDYTAAELTEIAGRIVTEKKRYNVAHGWTPDQDTLPERFLSEPVTTAAGTAVSLPRERLAQMVRSYNLRRGWDELGYPGE